LKQSILEGKIKRGDLVFYGRDRGHVAIIVDLFDEQTYFGTFPKPPVSEFGPDIPIIPSYMWTDYLNLYSDYKTSPYNNSEYIGRIFTETLNEYRNDFSEKAYRMAELFKCIDLKEGTPRLFYPHVVEHSEGILYHKNRSIINTADEYDQLTIVHIGDQ